MASGEQFVKEGTVKNNQWTVKDPSQANTIFLLTAQLHAVHRGWDPRSARPIPAAFGRHATVHALHETQYTEANAVIAVAHVASAIALIDGLLDHESPPTEW
jgi:hypothetical protein